MAHTICITVYYNSEMYTLVPVIPKPKIKSKIPISPILVLSIYYRYNLLRFNIMCTSTRIDIPMADVGNLPTLYSFKKLITIFIRK